MDLYLESNFPENLFKKYYTQSKERAKKPPICFKHLYVGKSHQFNFVSIRSI